MTTTYDPFHPALLRRGRPPRGDGPGLRPVPRLPAVLQVLHVVPLDVRGDRPHDDQDSAKHDAWPSRTRSSTSASSASSATSTAPTRRASTSGTLDFPRLMMRAEQVLHRDRPRSTKRQRSTTRCSGDTDLVGDARLGHRAARRTSASSTPGSLPRKVMEKVVGIHAERVLPPFARQRFSTWFRERRAWRRPSATRRAGRCVPHLPRRVPGHARSARTSCGSTSATASSARCPRARCCCGAPFLHQGDVDGFRQDAEKNVATLAEALRRARGHGERRVGRGATAHLRLHPEEGLRRLRGRCRRPARRRAHLRRRRVPHEGPPRRQGRRRRGLDTDVRRATCPRPSPTTRPATCGPRTSASRAVTSCKLTGTKITARGRVLGHRRHVGPARGELRHRPQGRLRRWPPTSSGPGPSRSRATARLRQRRHHPRDRPASPVHPLSLVARAYGIPEDRLVSPAKLTLDDIADLRAYERERAEFRTARHRPEEAPAHPRRARSSRCCSRTATRSASRSRRWPGSRRSSPTRASSRARRLQPAHPRARAPVGHAVRRAHHRRAAPGVAAEAGRHRDLGAGRPR